MKFLKCCGRISVVLDMVVLRPILLLVPCTFPLGTHEDSEVLWAYFCSIEMLVLIQIFGTSTTHFPSGHT